MSRMWLAIHGWFRTCEARISLICIRSSSNAPIVLSRPVNGSIQTTHMAVCLSLEGSKLPFAFGELFGCTNRSHPVNELIAAYTDNTMLCLSLEGSKLPWLVQNLCGKNNMQQGISFQTPLLVVHQPNHDGCLGEF